MQIYSKLPSELLYALWMIQKENRENETRHQNGKKINKIKNRGTQY